MYMIFIAGSSKPKDAGEVDRKNLPVHNELIRHQKLKRYDIYHFNNKMQA